MSAKPLLPTELASKIASMMAVLGEHPHLTLSMIFGKWRYSVSTYSLSSEIAIKRGKTDGTFSFNHKQEVHENLEAFKSFYKV